MSQLELKKVSDVMQENFFIPRYQRFYKWSSLQVEELLNDINDFNTEVKDSWYCVQPIVVKKCIDKENFFEVIDGQQRLITLYLIIKHFNEFSESSENKKPLPILEFETRRETYDFINKIKFNTKEDLEVKNEDKNKSIDFHYISSAYETIQKWFISKGKENNIDVDCFKSKVLDKTKFIWYLTDEEDTSKIFTRLNVGKIKLTSSELIKALLLSGYDNTDTDIFRLRQREIANEWENIEFTLQNDDFFSFICKDNKGEWKTSSTRIDYIFNIMFNEDSLQIKSSKDFGSDEYITFRYFYEYFHNNARQKEVAVQEVWQKIKSIFNIFVEWFNDVKLYHYIGYLINSCPPRAIIILLDEYRKINSKSAFINFLQEHIYDSLKDKIDYLEKDIPIDKSKVKNLLLFHNIQTIINMNNLEDPSCSFYRFPFFTYNEESWDVEHINSLTENDESDENTKKDFLLTLLTVCDDVTKEKIIEWFRNKNDDLYNAIKDELSHTNEEWDRDENSKNIIGNYCLLNSSINRSYKNAIFSAKRRVILSKEQGISLQLPKLNKDGSLESTEPIKEDCSCFIPVCTKNVFQKYYSSVASDFNYWTLEDARQYSLNILSCINSLKGAN